MLIVECESECRHVCWLCLLKILCNLLAVDGVNNPDVLAINAGESKHSSHFPLGAISLDKS